LNVRFAKENRCEGPELPPTLFGFSLNSQLSTFNCMIPAECIPLSMDIDFSTVHS
jgi:hypothetical protein